VLDNRINSGINEPKPPELPASVNDDGQHLESAPGYKYTEL
jgi:hypothetical protein